MSPPTDEQLFAEFRRRSEPELLAAVFDRLAPRVLRLALHLVGDPAEAEDVLQATFVTALEKRDLYDEKRPLLPWLLGILQVHARQARSRRRAPDPLRLPAREAERPDFAAESNEVHAEVRRAVESLPARYRTVLLLKLVHGLEPAEIAEALDSPPALVRQHIHRGLDLVRGALPRGIAVGALAAWFPTRGLAAIRAEVLHRIPIPTSASLPLGALGAAIVNKSIAGIGAVAALAAIVLVATVARAREKAVVVSEVARADAPVPQSAPAVVADAAPRVSSASDAGAPRSEIAGPASSPAAAASGAVHVYVSTQSGDDPVPGVGVAFVLDDGKSDKRDARWLRTGFDGTAATSLPPGRYLVHLDRTTGAGAKTDLVRREAAELARREEDRTKATAARGAVATARPAVDLSAARVEEVRMVEERAVAEMGPASTIDVRAGAIVQLQLTVKGSQLDVRVVDPEGRAVQGAEVWLARFSAPPHPSERLGLADADGRFSVAAVEGHQWIAARARGFGPTRTFSLWKVKDAGSGRATVELRLARTGGALSGRVVDPAGRPVANASLVVGPGLFDGGSDYAEDGIWAANAPPVHLITNDDGTFVAVGLAVGPNPVRVRAAGFPPVTRAVEIADGAAVEATIELPAGWSVSGRVSSTRERTLEGATVRAYVGDEIVATARPASDGAYAIDGLPMGSVVLQAQAREHAMRRRTVASGSRTAPICDFALEPVGKITGKATDSESMPLTRWLVVATPLAEGARSTAARVGSDGSFTIPTEATGSYRLALRSDPIQSPRPGPMAGGGPIGGVLVPSDLDAARAVGGREIVCVWLGAVSGDARDVAIVVPADVLKVAWIRGRVLDADGAPVKGGVRAYQGRDQTLGWSAIASDGSFRLGPFQDGDVRVVVQPESIELPLTTVYERFVAGGERVELGDLRLPQPGTLVLRGDLTNVQAIHGYVRDTSDRPLAMLTVGKSGEVRQALPPGRYRIDFFSMGTFGGGTPFAPQDVEIRAGQLTTATLSR
ncbi:MAG TPA: sigma-70 family RNA polymerase sigma factor [Planctomycetota bacterium]|nr:sigma-70 family RNA polymerase sigma factor [Planctomycetota bacterium]